MTTDHVAAHGPLPPLDRRPAAGRAGRRRPGRPRRRRVPPGRQAAGAAGRGRRRWSWSTAAEGEPVSAKDTVAVDPGPAPGAGRRAVVAAGLGARRVMVAVTDPTLAAVSAAPGAGRRGRPARVRAVGSWRDRVHHGRGPRAGVGADGGRRACRPAGGCCPPSAAWTAGRPCCRNAETLAQLAVLVRLGRPAFAAGRHPGRARHHAAHGDRRGGQPRRARGAARHPAGDGCRPRSGARPSQAVVVGGYHGAWLRPSRRLALSRAGLAVGGGTLGAGVVIFVGHAHLRRWPSWPGSRTGWRTQSAKQCGPCTFGLPALAGRAAPLARRSAGRSTVPRMSGGVTGRGRLRAPGRRRPVHRQRAAGR